jgi:regulator of replication initiation timing
MHGTLTERMSDIGDRMRERRTTGRMEHLDEENDRLRMELSSLRSMLDRERDDRDEILDALKGKPQTVVKKKRGGLLRMIVIGGGAYVLGARAGRERYNQLRDWANRMRDRARGTAEDLRDDIDDAVATTSETAPSLTTKTTSSKSSISDS